MAGLSAADWALKQVETVREDPAKRLELVERTYHGPTGEAPHHLPFRRAAMAFMGWELARSGGRGGAPSSAAIPLWMAFVDDPRRATWYRVHNASIVDAYLENRSLAEQ